MALLTGLNSIIHLSHNKPIDLGAGSRRQNGEVAQALANALASGDVALATALHGNFNQSGNGAKAGATLVFATSSGNVGADINGVAVKAASGAGTDVQDAALAAATINASVDALVAGFVRASEYAATLTLSSTAAGATVAIRVGSSGKGRSYVFTAISGTASVQGQFDVSGNDTADALALANAINATPVLNQTVRAESVAGVCYVYAMDRVITDKAVTCNGVTLTAAFAGVAQCHVECLVPGALGNAITFAAQGTNVTVANANTRLVGGLGGVSGTTKRASIGGVT